MGGSSYSNRLGTTIPKSQAMMEFFPSVANGKKENDCNEFVIKLNLVNLKKCLYSETLSYLFCYHLF